MPTACWPAYRFSTERSGTLEAHPPEPPSGRAPQLQPLLFRRHRLCGTLCPRGPRHMPGWRFLADPLESTPMIRGLGLALVSMLLVLGCNKGTSFKGGQSDAAAGGSGGSAAGGSTLVATGGSSGLGGSPGAGGTTSTGLGGITTSTGGATGGRGGVTTSTGGTATGGAAGGLGGITTASGGSATGGSASPEAAAPRWVDRQVAAGPPTIRRDRIPSYAQPETASSSPAATG